MRMTVWRLPFASVSMSQKAHLELRWTNPCSVPPVYPFPNFIINPGNKLARRLSSGDWISQRWHRVPSEQTCRLAATSHKTGFQTGAVDYELVGMTMAITFVVSAYRSWAFGVCVVGDVVGSKCIEGGFSTVLPQTCPFKVFFSPLGFISWHQNKVDATRKEIFSIINVMYHSSLVLLLHFFPSTLGWQGPWASENNPCQVFSILVHSDAVLIW